MKIIAVDKAGLMEELSAWGVNSEYLEFFLSKCADDGRTVSLRPFVFNDTIHLDDPRQWLASNVAFWCRVYREAQLQVEQIEALSGIRAIYYVAGMMGQGVITTAINAWWGLSFELHQLPAVNRSLGRPVAKSQSVFTDNPSLTH